MASHSTDRRRVRLYVEIADSSEGPQRPAPGVRPRTPEYEVFSEDESEFERAALASERRERALQRATQWTPPPTKPTQHTQPPGLNAPMPIPLPVFRPQPASNDDPLAAKGAIASGTGPSSESTAWHGGRSTPNDGRDDEYTVAPDPQSPTPLRYANRSSTRMPHAPLVGLAQVPVLTGNLTHVREDTVRTRTQASNLQQTPLDTGALRASDLLKTPPPALPATQAPDNTQLDSEVDVDNRSQSHGSRNSVSKNSIVEALTAHKGAVLYIFDQHVKEPGPQTRQMLLDCVNTLRLRILAVEKGRDATRIALRKSDEHVQQLEAKIRELKAESESNDQKASLLMRQLSDLQNSSRSQRRARGARARSARERNNGAAAIANAAHAGQ